MEPIFLTASCKDAIWGGTRLKEEFGKDGGERVAESWELSCHPNGPSVIRGGQEDGKTLAEYLKEHPEAIGTNGSSFEQFPILIKLIDAKKDLSVQVHPDNEYALKNEGQYGKTEMWYVVDCEPGARLLYGFSKELTPDEFARQIRENTLPASLNSVPVKKGDVFFIPSRTVHAIGAGILVAEIQQNSDVTYRIYDYGRLGTDGKPRQLHIEKAAQAADLHPVVPNSRPEGEPRKNGGALCTLLASCEYFTVEHIELNGEASFCADQKSFHCLLCLDQSAVIRADGKEYRIRKGETVFLPAGTGTYTLAGEADLLLTYL